MKAALILACLLAGWFSAPQAALAQSPRPAEQALMDEREAARQNRHEEAIAAFLEALASDPVQRPQLLKELADQHTWAGQLEEAIGLYREALGDPDPERAREARAGLARALAWAGRHGEALEAYDIVLTEDPAHYEAGLGKASVLTWMDRQGEALAQYRRVLDAHPGDREARRGEGRVLSWRGRYREAAARMETLLSENPGDETALVILAESLSWLGRPDRALERLVGAAPDSAPDRLRQRLQDDLRRSARADVRVFDQSDDLSIRQIALALDVPLAKGRARISPRLSVTEFEPADGTRPTIRLTRPGFETRYRVNDTLEINANLFLDRIDNGPGGRTRDVFTYDTWLTLLPRDGMRFDLSASRFTFDSERALNDGLNATEVKASGDWAPDERATYTLAVSQTDYSDGNERLWWQARASRKVLSEPRLVLGYRYTGFEYALPGQPGYFNPDRLDLNELTLEASGRFSEAVSWTLRGAVGHESEEPGGSRTTGYGGSKIAFALGERHALAVAYDYSSSRLDSAGGFSRGIGRVSLRTRF